MKYTTAPTLTAGLGSLSCCTAVIAVWHYKGGAAGGQRRRQAAKLS